MRPRFFPDVSHRVRLRNRAAGVSLPRPAIWAAVILPRRRMPAGGAFRRIDPFPTDILHAVLISALTWAGTIYLGFG